MVEAAGIGSLTAINGLRDRPISCRPPAVEERLIRTIYVK